MGHISDVISPTDFKHLQFNVFDFASKQCLWSFSCALCQILSSWTVGLTLIWLFLENKHLGHHLHSKVCKTVKTTFKHFCMLWSQCWRHIAPILILKNICNQNLIKLYIGGCNLNQSFWWAFKNKNLLWLLGFIVEKHYLV